MAPGWPSMLAAGAAGAYVASSADKSGMSDYMRGFAKTVGLELPSSSGRPFSSSSGSEMQVLQSEVDRLHKLLGDVVRGQRGAGYTVIHTGRGGAVSLLVYPVVIGGVLYLYMRWRGLGLSDFMYVTRSSLTNFRSTITESFTKIWEEMRKQKDEFMQRIGAVGAQQQQLMQQQTVMDDRLKHVGSNVEDIRYTADQIGHRVELLDNKMAEVGDGVQRANHGILLLCAAVAEVTKRVGMDARSGTHQMLHSYVQSAPQGAVQALNAPGLRSLLEDAPSASSLSMSAVTVTDVSGMGMLTSASSVPVEGSAVAGLPPLATGAPAQRGRTGSLPFLWHSSSNAGAGLAAASGTASARLAHS